MDNKKRLWIIIGAVAAVLLLCVILVGVIDGIWPWQIGGDLEDGYSGIFSGFKDSSDDEGDVGDTDSTKAAGEDDTQAADDTGSSSSTDSGSTDTTSATITVEIEVDDDDETTGSDQNGEDTESTSEYKDSIDFDDLLDKANGAD